MPSVIPPFWSDIPKSLSDRVGVRVGRQRVIVESGHALLLLHQLPKAGDRERTAVLFWRNNLGNWRCYPGRDDLTTLRAHVESYATALDQLDDEVEKAEGASQYLALIRRARPLARSCRNMHAALQQLREAFPHDEAILGVRDRAYEVERLSEMVAEDAEDGLQFTIAQHTEEQAQLSERIARETHRLNLLAAIALPITALGAILGMNLENGLERLPEPITFWAIVAIFIAFGLYLRSRVQHDPK